MSIQTPVFPLTDPPAGRTPSSSQSSVETDKQQCGLSYSSRLAQWHLALASLPYELCPATAPPSPGSQARSASLQSEIEKAVHDGRNISDFCKLRSTKLGYATKQPLDGVLEQGDGIPWILAETEEEWFQWEREVAQRRAHQRGKDRSINLVPPTQSRNAHDKVLNWKAGLLAPSASSATASPAPSANTARSSLGFPVVKSSTMSKGNKFKLPKLAPRSVPISTPNPEVEADGEEDTALRPDTRAVDVVYLATGGVEHGNLLTEWKPNTPPKAKRDSSAQGDLDKGPLEPHDLSAVLPPSFPSDLLTSTQKDVFGTALFRRDSSPFAAVLPASMLKEADRTNVTIEDKLQELEAENSPVPGGPIASNKSNIEPTRQQIPQLTPPSPPYSSGTSRHPIQRPDSSPETPVIHSSATPPPHGHVRPITPPSEAENNEPVLNEIHSSPRTPGRSRQQPSQKNLLAAPQAEALRGIGEGSTIVTIGHTTPDAAINGASVVRGNMFPHTPERQGKVLPDPLTTSRKSQPRPRPPSRKRSVQNMEIDADGAASEGGDVDPSPAKSERSYFSSPASGSSSGSDFSHRSMLFVPGSPTSPLRDFTQNPSRFAPLAHSTQVSSKAPLSPSPLHSRMKSHKSQSQSQKGIYDSQFDVDTRVDQLSNFLRDDVDLDAWVRATDTEADDEGDNDEDEDAHDVFAVEQMTKADPMSSLGSR